MTAAGYTEWLRRGRAHRRQGQPLDALQCFRRALRETPGAPDAAYLAGEMLWQLGRLDEAMRTWNDIASRHASFLPALHALSEAALGRNEHDSALTAAKRILELAPDDARARIVRAIVQYRRAGDERAGAVARIRDLAIADPTWLTVPALGGSLALGLEEAPDADLLAAIAAAAAGHQLSARIDTRLHALICEKVAAPMRDAAWFDALLARSLNVNDHDALRRAARAAGHADMAVAALLARAYAQLCAGAFRAPVPLLWPARTAGERLRIALVAANDAQVSLAREWAAREGSQFDVALVCMQAAEEDAARFQRIIPLGPAPGATEARMIAAFDPDALVDLTSLESPIGPMLAQRPARHVVALAARGAVLAPPLVDEIVGGSALTGHLRTLPKGGTSPADLATLDAAWQAAVTAHQAGDAGAAHEGYAGVLAWQPGFAPALYLDAVLARERGDLDAARTGFASALASAPDYHDARSGALKAAADAHDAAAIEALCAGVAADAPASVWRAAGEAWLTVHDAERAAAFLSAALEREPAHGETHYNLGVALQMKRSLNDAARSYQRALVCNPELIASDFNLGVIFAELGNRAGAIVAFSEVVHRDPTHVAAQKNLCEALRAAGRIGEWLAQFRRFEAACPASFTMAVHALEACHHAGDAAGVDRYLAGLDKDRFAAANDVELADALEELLYLVLYFDVDPQMPLRLAETYDRAAMHVYGSPLPQPASRTPGRLRIGYLSADLRNHVMGKMMYQVIARHDRSRFDVRLYALSSERDEWTERFVAAADAFVPLAALDDAAAVRRIAEDDLDILVDLNTHTRGARPGILARKPARVAITHVASAGTLGMRAIDFKLTDAFADTPDAAQAQLEPLLLMEGCVYPYRSIAPAATHGYTRKALDVAQDAVVFGAFVNPLKLSRRCLALWRDVLAQVPAGVLAFSPLDNALRAVYVRLATAAGIDPARIVFLPASPDDAVNQARYDVVDVVLDPMPFGGVNGTLEALDREVPVVTLLGKRHGERSTYSILSNLGVTATVATTGPEYVALAARLAHDAAFRDEVRRAIRAGLAGSALIDMDAHTRNLEAAYLRALEARAPEVLAHASARS